jgi:apolipoprotein N-acyltransferase
MRIPLPLWSRALLIVLAAVLYVLAFPPTALWGLAFLALAPALVATAGLAPRAAFRWGLLLGFLVGAAGLTWFRHVFGPLAPVLWLVLGLWFGLFFCGRAVLHRALPPVPAMLGTVLLWTAVEFFRAEGYPLRCTLLTLGHALAAETFPFRFAARWVGAAGLGLLAAAVNVGLARALLPGCRNRWAGIILVDVGLGAAAVLSIAALAGLDRTPATGRSVAVAALQAEPNWVSEHAALCRSAGSREPDWVLWPELTVRGSFGPREEGAVAELARELDAAVGLGVRLDHPTASPNFWNAYVVFGRDGERLGTYYKMQPVPMMLDGVPGEDYTVFDTAHARMGVAICYDGDFSWIPRRLVAAGAEILVIPIFDPARWGRRMREQHLAAGALRALENGREVVRPANAPPTLIFDHLGRVAHRLDRPGPGVLVGRVAPRTGRTVYNRVGWLLPWGCQAASALLLVWAGAVLWRRRRGRARRV